MKFARAVYISFMGDCSFGTIKSFFYQADKSLNRSYKIKINSKKLPYETIPFVRINFPFEGKDVRYKDKKLNINDNNKTNYQVAIEMIQEVFSKLEPGSIIYIEAHGKKNDNCIIQNIKMPGDNQLLSFEIYYEDLAEIFAKHIPERAKKNLQIKLIVCNAQNFAENLMEELDQKSFTKSAVIAYNDTVVISFGDQINKNTFKISDFSSKSRVDNKFLFTGRFNHGKEYSDNKIVYHNYNGYIYGENYRNFSKNYLRNSIDIISSDYKEIIGLRNMILESITQYLENYDKKNLYYGIIHVHGNSGYNRIMEFYTEIDSVSIELVNGPTEEVIKKIINEIKLFANKEGNYKKYSGRINVEDNSGITFIMKGLRNFYQLNRNIQSQILINFFHNVFVLSTSALFQDIDKKAIRQCCLDKLKKYEFPNV
ncbi:MULTISPECIES: hypothetical protein [unclassified Francisella]|uniref:hypothetical protein n=1 Tax=unclassified Francisella TaxID=2610885 RepID=UPI002E3004E9|nr:MULTISPECIES: hypothetical protein [unclassified Francisella]MED7819016.1 hypothetical protein [Francisella sp. 19S2-4]MED7829827.1 hypothetical protein [Francisella sp. 19S2-10]